MSFLDLSSLVGAAALVTAALSIGRRRLRVRAVVIGSVGLIAAAAAVLTYTLYHFGRGLDIDAIPHERGAQWFVAAFGWGALAALATILLPPVRRWLAAYEASSARPPGRVVRFRPRPGAGAGEGENARRRRDRT